MMQCFVGNGVLNFCQQIRYAVQQCLQPTHRNTHTQPYAAKCNPMTALIQVVTASQVMLTLLGPSSNVADHLCRQAFKDAI